MKVLYLSPAEGEPTGLADYGLALRRATAGAARGLELVPGSAVGATEIPWRMPRLRERVNALVGEWRRTRALAPFDLVHIEIGGGSYREYYFADALTRQRTGPPRVITLHDPPFTVGRTLSDRWPVRTLAARLMRRSWELTVGFAEERAMLEGARAIITLSAGGADAVRSRFPRLRVPVSFIEHIAFPMTADAAAAQPVQEVVLLWLGYPVKGAGLDLLLQALGDIVHGQANGLPPWRLEIAGPLAVSTNGSESGELRREIERRGLRDHVHLLGFVPEAELPALLERSQVLVLPRERRGHLRHELHSVSGSMIRAMSAGLAIVASDARAAAEEIVSGKNGLLVASGDPRGLAEAIRTLLGEPALRARLGREAQEHVRRAHAPGKIVADHRSVYLAAKRNGGVPVRDDVRRASGPGERS